MMQKHALQFQILSFTGHQGNRKNYREQRFNLPDQNCRFTIMYEVVTLFFWNTNSLCKGDYLIAFQSQV